MNTTQFFERLEASIARHDLLCHPFYKTWSAGELTRDDLREYACQYYHHVEAFPWYLAELALRLDEGELRRAVLANMCDEKGAAGGSEKDSVPHSEPHSELWLDFAEGMGARRDLRGHQPLPEIKRHSGGSARSILCLRIAGAAGGQGERTRPTRNVRR